VGQKFNFSGYFSALNFIQGQMELICFISYIVPLNVNNPPAREAIGEFRIFIRLAVFSRCLSVCDIFCCFMLTFFSIGVRGVDFEILLLPEFLC